MPNLVNLVELKAPLCRSLDHVKLDSSKTRLSNIVLNQDSNPMLNTSNHGFNTSEHLSCVNQIALNSNGTETTMDALNHSKKDLQLETSGTLFANHEQSPNANSIVDN